VAAVRAIILKIEKKDPLLWHRRATVGHITSEAVPQSLLVFNERDKKP
jgi:hypothetical protein